MKLLMTILFFSISVGTSAKERVAVLDTGHNSFFHSSYLCDSGHKDFTGTGIHDTHGHGSNVISLIGPKLRKDQCIVTLKVFGSLSYMPSHSPLEIIVRALRYVKEQKFEYVNMSMSGVEYSGAELALLLDIVKQSKVVVAAGNENLNFDFAPCVIYPACYPIHHPNFFVVGAYDVTRSNRGRRIKHWAAGFNQGSPTMTGTSQATANFTARLLRSK